MSYRTRSLYSMQNLRLPDFYPHFIQQLCISNYRELGWQDSPLRDLAKFLLVGCDPWRNHWHTSKRRRSYQFISKELGGSLAWTPLVYRHLTRTSSATISLLMYQILTPKSDSITTPALLKVPRAISVNSCGNIAKNFINKRLRWLGY